MQVRLARGRAGRGRRLLWRGGWRLRRGWLRGCDVELLLRSDGVDLRAEPASRLGSACFGAWIALAVLAAVAAVGWGLLAAAAELPGGRAGRPAWGVLVLGTAAAAGALAAVVAAPAVALVRRRPRRRAAGDPPVAGGRRRLDRGHPPPGLAPGPGGLHRHLALDGAGRPGGAARGRASSGCLLGAARGGSRRGRRGGLGRRDARRRRRPLPVRLRGAHVRGAGAGLARAAAADPSAAVPPPLVPAVRAAAGRGPGLASPASTGARVCVGLRRRAHAGGARLPGGGGHGWAARRRGAAGPGGGLLRVHHGVAGRPGALRPGAPRDPRALPRLRRLDRRARSRPGGGPRAGARRLGARSGCGHRPHAGPLRAGLPALRAGRGGSRPRAIGRKLPTQALWSAGLRPGAARPASRT